MKLALCNEVLAGHDFAAQCAIAAALGYDGLEVAPFTLGKEPGQLPAAERRSLRRTAEDAGLRITGLHWLLVTPKGLSITDRDPDVRARTVSVIEDLVELCADLGGSVLVHGSPAQRSIGPDDDPQEARQRALDVLGFAARAAERAGVVYCLEPLAPNETNFVNTVAEAAEIVRAIGSPAFRTMIDTSAAGQSEAQPVSELIAKWLTTGLVAHIQLNDRNRKAPGQGTDDFVAILRALRAAGYQGIAAVEPFVYEPDGPGSAAWAAGYVRGILAAIDGLEGRER